MLDSSALAALSAIGDGLPADSDGKTFAEIQADSERKEQQFTVLTERLQRAIGAYQRTAWLLDGAPEYDLDYAGRKEVFAAFHGSPDPEAFVEKFEADLANLRRQLDEMPRQERMRLLDRI